jgi:hypothetical protein
MKRIIISTLLILVSIFTFSQTPKFARAYGWTDAHRDKNSGELVWNGKPKDCDYVCRFYGNDVGIYTNPVQRLHVISKIESENMKSSMYRAIDSYGVLCNYYLGYVDDVLFITIEYKDTAYMYFLQPE